jgi:hypothetical protein
LIFKHAGSGQINGDFCGKNDAPTATLKNHRLKLSKLIFGLRPADDDNSFQVDMFVLIFPHGIVFCCAINL